MLVRHFKAIDDADDGTMSDFLSKSFSSKDEIDFDRAASAFPDISLDGSGDIPTPTFGGGPVISHQTSSSSYADFDDFVTPPPHNDVKVTGDDEFEQFESHFPDIDVPVERKLSLLTSRFFSANVTSQTSPPVVQQQPTFGGAPTFAPRPQPPASAATPIFNAQLEEDEPEVIRCGSLWTARRWMDADIQSQRMARKARGGNQSP